VENESARLEHWSTGWTAVNQGDSNPVPFCGHEGRFRGKEALEIGPGEGRQYKAVHDRCLSYAIADVSQQALDCPIFDDVDWKLRIRDIRIDSFCRKFDIVHFWYVLHHVPMIEVYDFFSFAHNHLHRNGLIMFNTPYLDFAAGCYSDDGVNTTRHNIADIVNLLDPLFFIETIDGTKYERSNGHIYIGRRK
jgi:2-polyprenyl-3-methyl-5-hydroxy-6-metoxy-1,4-benzoquinol methylase